MSNYQLTPTQLQQVKDYLSAGNYVAAYGVIEFATEGAGYDAHSWFDHAAAINSGVGPASQFIRTYMDVATALGFGVDNDLTDADYQEASNLIAQNVLGRIIDKKGMLPSVQQIIDQDAKLAIDHLNLHPLEWGGTPGQWPFQIFGYDTADPQNAEEMAKVIMATTWATVEAGVIGSYELVEEWIKEILPELHKLQSDQSLIDWLEENIISPDNDLIDQIKQQLATAADRRSPLTLDLDGDGVVETTAVSQSAIHFDHDNNGFAEQTGWVGKDDGLLVLDKNHNQQIDDGSELFGNHTRLADGSTASHGFEALQALDSNADGQIDQQDAAFAQLNIWQDKDMNSVNVMVLRHL